MVISDDKTARLFGDHIVEASRAFVDSTSISAGIDFADSDGSSSIAKRMASAACANLLYPNGCRLDFRLRVGNSSASVLTWRVLLKHIELMPKD